MTVLEEFLEDITVAGAQLEPRCKAYRMDGTSPSPDMREKAGLGTCNCCDYFIFGSDKDIILIEETRLAEQIKDLMQKYSYLNFPDQQGHVTKIILQENRLKVYGSLLVLCRLFCREADGVAASVSPDTRYSFWLVASVEEPADEIIAIDYVRDRLNVELRGLLTKAVVDSVEIVPADALAERLASAYLAP